MNTDRIKILAENEQGEEEEIILPEWLEQKLVLYLRDKRSVELDTKHWIPGKGCAFDCETFVYFLKDWTPHLPDLKAMEVLGIEPGNCEVALSVGDIAYLSTAPNVARSYRGGYFHFMVYLGKGLYLSKHGPYDIVIEKYDPVSTSGLKLFRVTETEAQ